MREVGYVDKAQDFLLNTLIDVEVELWEPKMVMTVDEAERSTPMAWGIMVV